jgi:TetR/AcrR family tetracycline transcriptional repressor
MTRKRSAPVSAELVVRAALRIVQQDGAASLSMRRLADELGVSVTSVYYHVGNRDELVDQVIYELLREAWFLAASGDGPQERVLSQLAAMRRVLLEQGAAVELASERGRLGWLLAKAERAVLRELARHGLVGEEAAVAARVLTCHAFGFALLDRGLGAGPPPVDRASLDAAFAVAAGALVSKLVPPG